MSTVQPRVLMVLDALLVGGTETHVLTLTRSLLARGVYVSICAGHGALESEFEKLGCHIHYVPFFGAWSRRERASIRRTLTSIIREERITHIHVHQLHSGQMALTCARNQKLAVIATVHGKYYDLKTMRSMQEKGVQMIAVSPPVRKWMKAQGVDASVIPNGISLQHFRPKKYGLSIIRKKLNIPQTAQVVVYAGRLAGEKADVCRRVIDACSQLQANGHSNLLLIIVGGGIHADAVKAYARQVEKRTGRSYVRFLGTHKAMRPLYAVSNCVVGTGRVALEAMSCARPVVAIGSAGLYGRIRPQKLHSAWHYYFGDHAAPYPHNSHKLSQQIQRILASKHRQARYGDAGRAFVAERFDSNKIVHRIHQIYRHARPIQ